MSYMSWSPKLSVGVDKFDGEHQQILGFINELHEAMMQGKGKEVTGGILSRLVQYTVQHFRNEEQVMQRHGYPDYAAHKAEHDKLIKEVNGLMEELAEGNLMVGMDLMKLLKEWLSHHICETDKHYGPFFAEKQVA